MCACVCVRACVCDIEWLLQCCTYEHLPTYTVLARNLNIKELHMSCMTIDHALLTSSCLRGYEAPTKMTRAANSTTDRFM